MLWLLLPLIALILLSSYGVIPQWGQHAEQVAWTDTAQWYKVAVEDYAVEREKTWRYEVSMLNEHKHTYLYIRKDSLRPMPERGDTLWVYTQWHKADSIGSFDYQQYLSRKGISGTGYANSRRWTTANKCQVTIRDAQALRHRLMLRYKEVGITGNEHSVLSAMTLGYREELDPDIRQSFQRSGAAHILAVSGLHTGIVYMVVLWLFTLFRRFKPLYANRLHQFLLSGVIIASMVAYAALTGWSPSVTRSVIMIALVEIARVLHRQLFSMNTLIAAAFFILFFRPQDLYSISLQLSFAAVAAILLIEPSLRRLFPLYGLHGHWYTIANYIRTLITVSVAATLGTMPLSLYYFHQVSHYFLLTNLIVLPLTTILVEGAFLLFTIGWLPFIGTAIGWVLQHLTHLMNNYIHHIEQLPFAVSDGLADEGHLIAMYTIIILATIMLRRITQ